MLPSAAGQEQAQRINNTILPPMGEGHPSFPLRGKEILSALLGEEKVAAFHAALLGLFDPVASHAQCPLYRAGTRRRLGFDGTDCAERNAVSGGAPRVVDLALGKSSRRAWALSGAHRLSLHAWHASWQQGQTGEWCEGGAGPRIRRLVTFARHVVQTGTCSPAVSGQETRHVRSGGGTTAHALQGFREGIALPSRASPFGGKSGRDGEPPPRGAPWETANAWRSARSSPLSLT